MTVRLHRQRPIPEKPEWGNREHIQLVRHFDAIRNGLLPVTRLTSWGSFKNEFGTFNYCNIECPECLTHHKVMTDNDTDDFYMDSNFCVCCEQEFVFTDNSEFDLYVNAEQG